MFKLHIFSNFTHNLILEKNKTSLTFLTRKRIEKIIFQTLIIYVIFGLEDEFLNKESEYCALRRESAWLQVSGHAKRLKLAGWCDGDGENWSQWCGCAPGGVGAWTGLRIEKEGEKKRAIRTNFRIKRES